MFSVLLERIPFIGSEVGGDGLRTSSQAAERTSSAKIDRSMILGGDYPALSSVSRRDCPHNIPRSSISNTAHTDSASSAKQGKQLPRRKSSRVSLEQCQNPVTPKDSQLTWTGRLLIEACEQGSADTVRFLLSKAPNLVDFADFSSSKDLNFLDLPVTDGQLPRTPLGVAAAHGHYEIVQCLVDEFDADVRAYCDTALFLATVAENVSIVDYLLDNGAVLRSGNLNPVAWASKMNNPVLLASLLRCGNPGRDIAQPALELAVQAGHVEIVEILFNIAEADSRADDDRLIRLAVQKEHWRLVHFLLDVVYEPFVNTDPAALVVRDEARAAMPVHISEAFMMKEHAALDSNYTEDEKDDYEAPVQISPHPETEIEFLSTNPTTSEMGAIVDEHELLDVEANNNVQHTTSSEEYILEAQEVTVVVGIPTIEVNMVTAEEPVGDGISGLDISPSFTAASAISSTDQSESDFCLV